VGKIASFGLENPSLALGDFAHASKPTSLFTERALCNPHISAPVQGQNAASHVPLKAAMWPVADPRYKPMPDGIEMDIVNVAHEISVVSNQMLPIPTLPNPFLTFGDFARRANRGGWKRARKPGFDQTPPERKIRILIR
jgi:hypothetical protein